MLRISTSSLPCPIRLSHVVGVVIRYNGVTCLRYVSCTLKTESHPSTSSSQPPLSPSSINTSLSTVVFFDSQSLQNSKAQTFLARKAPHRLI
ncbi:hypothetical protein LWI28_014898 [Acer negundo]|uniref:Uncharacterized protein n=1 Tax=Acer negundo TaxID=4023 RepID=A0AAD5NVT0_ACENE|nr:hypothetical protein LWI28_014898 [Acer negundo]